MMNFSSDMLSAAAADQINNSLLRISNRLQAISFLLKVLIVKQFGIDDDLRNAFDNLDNNIAQAEHNH